jgi:hypothetical protein
MANGTIPYCLPMTRLVRIIYAQFLSYAKSETTFIAVPRRCACSALKKQPFYNLSQSSRFLPYPCNNALPQQGIIFPCYRKFPAANSRFAVSDNIRLFAMVGRR